MAEVLRRERGAQRGDRAPAPRGESPRGRGIGALVEHRSGRAIVQAGAQSREAAAAPQRRRELGAHARLDDVRHGEAVRGVPDVAL